MQGNSIRVWDLPTRLFHWVTVLLVAVAYVSDDAMIIHATVGYLILLLIFFRLGWGVVGTRYARFDDFIKGPGTVGAYIGKLMTFRPGHSVGHNPLGGWMVVALIVVLFLTSFTGLFLSEDGFVGPLASGWGEGPGDLHEGLTGLLGGLIFIHVGGVVADWLLTGDNIVRAMISGYKDAKVVEHGDPAAAEIEHGPGVATRAIVIFGLALALTWAIVG